MKRNGYNLIEVLIAITLLAWVVLVIAGLFIHGQRGIYSGKQQTKAVALGQKIYEDIASLIKDDKYKIFLGQPNDTNRTTTYTTSSTNPFNYSENPVLFNVYEDWISRLKDLSENAYITCTLTGLRSKTQGGTPTFNNCIFLRYELRIGWTQVQRERHVDFSFVFGGL